MTDTVETLADLLREVMGEDVDPDLAITAETSFSDDLELESIEFVALAERLQAHYGDRLDFVAWLSGKELDDLIQLRVGDLAAFIDQCLSSPPAD